MSDGHHTLRAVIDTDNDLVCIEKHDGLGWVDETWYELHGEKPVQFLRGHGYELDEAAVENGAQVVYLREIQAVA